LTSVPPNVFRELLSTAVVLAVVVPATGNGVRQQPPSNVSPANQSDQAPGTQAPGNQSGPEAQDPAAVLFTTDAGLVLHAVKPASVADYEAAIFALKDAFSAADTDPETQKVASAWRIYKATEPDAKANVIYVHLLDPAAAGVDYRPSLWLDKLLAGAPADLLSKYRDSFAVPPTKLYLTLVTKKGG
jgi:hypothetical protein